MGTELQVIDYPEQSAPVRKKSSFFSFSMWIMGSLVLGLIGRQLIDPAAAPVLNRISHMAMGKVASVKSKALATVGAAPSYCSTTVQLHPGHLSAHSKTYSAGDRDAIAYLAGKIAC